MSARRRRSPVPPSQWRLVMVTPTNRISASVVQEYAPALRLLLMMRKRRPDVRWELEPAGNPPGGREESVG